MLNEEQKRAVQLTEGPVMIIAGAGTGKTFTLINRIDYLIKEKGIDPSKILTITFTNKAANELKERLFNMGHKKVNALTFHSLAAKLLRKFWNPDFKIIDNKQQKEIISAILQDHEIKKQNQIFNDMFGNDRKSNLSDNRLKEIKEKYEQVLNKENLLDFNGLLKQLVDVLKNSEGVLEKCRDLFEYVLVDEYQDVSENQVEIVKQLVEKHLNICVVGDPDQIIYSWRGATVDSMSKFTTLFDDVKKVILKKNYRNPEYILKGAESLIKNNKSRIDKKLEPVVKNSNKINYWEADNNYHEIDILFLLLEKYLGSTSSMHLADEYDNEEQTEFRNFSDIALLYRTQHTGTFLAEQLNKKGYPYQLSNSKYFWDHKEILEFISELEKVTNADFSNLNIKFSNWIGDLIENFISKGKFSDSQKNRLKHLIVYSINYDHLDLNDALNSFLDEIRTKQDADNLVFNNKINLLTLHASKGLEFPVVLIFGLEEGNIPNKKSIDDEYFLQEERRLLFVGLTRATDELHIFYKKKIGEKFCERSRFLSEIGMENMLMNSLPEERKFKLQKKQSKRAQMSLF